MQQVGTHDKRWQIALDWSSSNREWTVSLDQWNRSGPFADWALEERWVSARVSLGHLQNAMGEVLQELARQVAVETGESPER